MRTGDITDEVSPPAPGQQARSSALWLVLLAAIYSSSIAPDRQTGRGLKKYRNNSARFYWVSAKKPSGTRNPGQNHEDPRVVLYDAIFALMNGWKTPAFPSWIMSLKIFGYSLSQTPWVENIIKINYLKSLCGWTELPDLLCKSKKGNEPDFLYIVRDYARLRHWILLKKPDIIIIRRYEIQKRNVLCQTRVLRKGIPIWNPVSCCTCPPLVNGG